MKTDSFAALRVPFTTCRLPPLPPQGIAHCPSSNLRLASGIANVRKALDTGVNVGLGVDGSCSNDCGNMIQEVRMAMLVARHAGRASDMPVRQALALATKGGAVNLGRADDIGQLAPGYAADFVAWKAAGNLGMAGTVCDPVACLVLCMPGNVDLNVVNGRVIIKDGKFTELDLEALLAEHAKHSAKLMKPYM